MNNILTRHIEEISLTITAWILPNVLRTFLSPFFSLFWVPVTVVLPFCVVCRINDVIISFLQKENFPSFLEEKRRHKHNEPLLKGHSILYFHTAKVSLLLLAVSAKNFKGSRIYFIAVWKPTKGFPFLALIVDKGLKDVTYSPHILSSDEKRVGVFVGIAFTAKLLRLVFRIRLILRGNVTVYNFFVL